MNLHRRTGFLLFLSLFSIHSSSDDDDGSGGGVGRTRYYSRSVKPPVHCFERNDSEIGMRGVGREGDRPERIKSRYSSTEMDTV